MKKNTLHSLFALLTALVMAVCLLTGCGAADTEQVEAQEDAETIQVYLWTAALYDTYAPYIQAQLPDVNIEFIVGNNDLDFCSRTAVCRISSPAAASHCTMQRP